MENRRYVTEELRLRIGNKQETFPFDLTWKMLVETEGVLPDDVFNQIVFIDEKESGAFGYKMPDELETFTVPYLIVHRRRLETDDEYFKRMKYEEETRKRIEEKEKLEYLRLKAKFETQQS